MATCPYCRTGGLESLEGHTQQRCPIPKQYEPPMAEKQSFVHVCLNCSFNILDGGCYCTQRGLSPGPRSPCFCGEPEHPDGTEHTSTQCNFRMAEPEPIHPSERAGFFCRDCGENVLQDMSLHTCLEEHLAEEEGGGTEEARGSASEVSSSFFASKETLSHIILLLKAKELFPGTWREVTFQNPPPGCKQYLNKVLKKQGITNLGQLVDYETLDLLTMVGFGKVTQKYVFGLLSEHTKGQPTISEHKLYHYRQESLRNAR